MDSSLEVNCQFQVVSLSLRPSSMAVNEHQGKKATRNTRDRKCMLLLPRMLHGQFFLWVSFASRTMD